MTVYHEVQIGRILLTAIGDSVGVRELRLLSWLLLQAEPGEPIATTSTGLVIATGLPRAQLYRALNVLEHRVLPSQPGPISKIHPSKALGAKGMSITVRPIGVLAP